MIKTAIFIVIAMLSSIVTFIFVKNKFKDGCIP